MAHTRANFVLCLMICLRFVIVCPTSTNAEELPHSHQEDESRNDLSNAQHGSEKMVLEGIQNAENSLKADIDGLARKISHMNNNADQCHGIINEFYSEHTYELKSLSSRIEASLVYQNNNLTNLTSKLNETVADWSPKAIVTRATEAQREQAALLLLHSLDFPERADRDFRIRLPYEKTYEWILRNYGRSTRTRHNFVAWLEAPGTKGFYWIYGWYSRYHDCS